jgi:hypothetical protein
MGGGAWRRTAGDPRRRTGWLGAGGGIGGGSTGALYAAVLQDLDAGAAAPGLAAEASPRLARCLRFRPLKHGVLHGGGLWWCLVEDNVENTCFAAPLDVVVESRAKALH